MIFPMAFQSRSRNHQDSHHNPWRCLHQSSWQGQAWVVEVLASCWSWQGWSTFCSSSTSWFLAGSWMFLALTLSSQRWRNHLPWQGLRWALVPWLALKIKGKYYFIAAIMEHLWGPIKLYSYLNELKMVNKRVMYSNKSAGGISSKRTHQRFHQVKSFFFYQTWQVKKTANSEY